MKSNISNVVQIVVFTIVIVGGVFIFQDDIRNKFFGAKTTSTEIRSENAFSPVEEVVHDQEGDISSTQSKTKPESIENSSQNLITTSATESGPEENSISSTKFSKFGDEYDTIFLGTIFSVNGKLAYGVQDKGDSYIVYDGKQIGGEYDSVESVLKIGEKLAFLAIKDRKSFIVYDGIELGKEYYSVSEPVNIGGILAYMGQKVSGDDVAWYGNYGGKEVTEENGRFFFDPKDDVKTASVNGKLAYVAQADETWYVVYDGVPVGKKYIRSSHPKSIGGKLAYSASKDNKGFIVHDGVEVGKEYDNAGDQTEVNGKLAYIATLGTKYFVVYDGKKYGKEYDKNEILFVSNTSKEVGGKLVYEAYDIKAEKPLVVYDTEILGPTYDKVDYESLQIINGKLTYIAFKESKALVVQGNTEFKNGYTEISKLIEVNGKIAYEAVKNGKSIIVYNEVEYGQEFDGVGYPVDVNDKLAFYARKGYKQFMMFEN